MFDWALVTGIILAVVLLGTFAVVAILVLRRQGRHARHDHGGYVPPPVDPGHHEPEQAKDVNAEKDS
ncbi:hypothetical protein [Pseudolysinimonas sp.]